MRRPPAECADGWGGEGDAAVDADGAVGAGRAGDEAVVDADGVGGGARAMIDGGVGRREGEEGGGCEETAGEEGISHIAKIFILGEIAGWWI